jgi:hypothetical protein
MQVKQDAHQLLLNSLIWSIATPFHLVFPRVSLLLKTSTREPPRKVDDYARKLKVTDGNNWAEADLTHGKVPS